MTFIHWQGPDLPTSICPTRGCNSKCDMGCLGHHLQNAAAICIGCIGIAMLTSLLIGFAVITKEISRLMHHRTQERGSISSHVRIYAAAKSIHSALEEHLPRSFGSGIPK